MSDSSILLTEQPLLKVVAASSGKFIQVVKDGGEIQFRGILVEVLDVLVKKLGMKFQLMEPPDGTFGKLLSNGSWTGMIGMLARREADIALDPFSMTPERNQVINFASVLQHSMIVILTPRPSITRDVGGFLKPFPLDVWLLVLLSLILTSITLIFILTWEGKLFNFELRGVYSKSLMWAVKSITQEGSEWLPTGDCGRILVSTWLLACLVFTSCYSGILTAMLTSPRITIPIDSLKDLVSQRETHWKFGSRTLHAAFQKSTDVTESKAHGLSSGIFPGCWPNREQMTSGKYAGICASAQVANIFSWDFSTTGTCHVYQARKPVYANDIEALALQPGSPFLNQTNRIIDSLKESGILNLWISQYSANATHCKKPPSADKSSNSALDIEALGGPYFLLVGGYQLAFLTFIAEAVFPHFDPRMQMNWEF